MSYVCIICCCFQRPYVQSNSFIYQLVVRLVVSDLNWFVKITSEIIWGRSMNHLYRPMSCVLLCKLYYIAKSIRRVTWHKPAAQCKIWVLKHNQLRNAVLLKSAIRCHNILTQSDTFYSSWETIKIKYLNYEVQLCSCSSGPGAHRQNGPVTDDAEAQRRCGPSLMTLTFSETSVRC